MSSPSGPDHELPRLKHKAPARTPSSLPSLSLRPGLGRVREIITSHTSSPRPESSAAQSTSDSHADLSDHRHITNSFPNLVYDILQRARAVPDTPERVSDETSHIPHVQIEGRKVWEEFQSHATILEKDLQKFQDSVQELGSSLDLSRAARAVRESLFLISQKFQENTSKLFPRALIPQRAPRTASGTWYSRKRPTANAHLNADHNLGDRPVHVELKLLAEGVGCLRLALEQFPDFNNIEVWHLVSFEANLRHWSSTLETYEKQFESREVRSYIHELSRELGTQFEDTSLCLREIMDGVPTARLSQKHALSNLQSLATIATFFSAVTATTLQYSFEDNDTNVDKAVNVFWFTSLVCSIASALNSFLVLTWRRANYTRLRIPWWLLVWIRQCPTLFLLASVVAFLAGLACFTVSRQPLFTSIIVIISEVVSAFGLAALLVLLAYDKWTFYASNSPLTSELPVVQDNSDSILLPTIGPSSSWYIPADPAKQQLTAESTLTLSRTVTEQSSVITPGQKSERARQRWESAIKNVRLVSKALRIERGREVLETLHMDALDPRLRKLVVSAELVKLEAGKETSDIQFDSLGKYLAVCGKGLSMRYELASKEWSTFRHYMGRARQMVWESSGEYLITRTTQAIYVWKIGGVVPQQSVILRNDVSRYILGIPTSKSTDTPNFISIEREQRNKLAIIDIKGQQDMVHDFENITIEHLDITPRGTRVVIAASVIHSMDMMQHVKRSSGHKLMVFNLETHQVEHQVPLWHKAQYVTISESGKWVVVTYKDHPPPQLWHLHRTPDGIQLVLDRQFCARERVSAHEFDPFQHIQFIGRGHFVYNDRYVMSTTTDGKIHMWRRDKSHPVHVHDRLTLDKDKPVQIACSKASNEFMFATRSRDGSVRIWKVQDPPTIQIQMNTPGVSVYEQTNTESPGTFIARGPVTESPQSEKPSEPITGPENEE